jgi:hypothetical protein
MKQALSFISVLLFTLILTSFQGDEEQSCVSYFPLMKGNKTELTISKGNGDFKGKIIYEIAGFEHLGKRNKSKVSTIYFDKNNKPFYVGEVSAICYKNNTDLDIMALLPFDIIKTYANKTFKSTSDKIDLPIEAKALDKLRDGNVDIEVFSGKKKITDINLNIYNRQVDAVENVITSVGEFKCIKTSYSLKTNMATSKQNKVLEWYSREIGLVKFERYDKKGHLIEKGALTKVEK